MKVTGGICKVVSIWKVSFTPNVLETLPSAATQVAFKSEPHAGPRVDPPVDGSAPQRARSVIHALSRVDNHGTRPLPEEQRVPGYSGASCSGERFLFKINCQRFLSTKNYRKTSRRTSTFFAIHWLKLKSLYRKLTVILRMMPAWSSWSAEFMRSLAQTWGTFGSHSWRCLTHLHNVLMHVMLEMALSTYH